MPPPNITGKLHMGHALFLTIQDSLNRYYKNLGYNSLWLPGLDHAGLATYDKIQDYQKEMGLSYEEASLELPAKNKNIILEQITQLGALPQWDYLSYTLDKEYEEFTLKILKLLHKQNRITYEKGQYFLDIADYAHLLDQDLEAGKFNIIPKYEIKNLSPFLKNLEKWNISRQIPWGTRLPFKQDGSNILFEECGSSDSLDTWFNSSLWPLASLIKNPQLIKDFYPATLIETGSDILFFWCARMLMMSHFIFDNQKELGLDLPEPYAFKTIYLHGLIRDKNGEKFSKSLGNGIDPLDMIKKYGADSTRLFIISRSGPSEDIIFNEELLPAQTKFINKIYQSARFFSIQSQKFELEKLNNQELIAPNKQLEQHQLHYGLLMDNYNFLEASRYIQSIYKQWFCDEWIEQNKQQIWDGNKETIYQGILILNQLLAMLDPFSPYISYQLHNEFFNK